MLKGRAAAISIAVAIVLAAVLLYYSLRGIEWKEVGRIIANANRRVLLFAAFLATCSLLLRSLRWRVLLNAEGRIGVPAVFWATAAGYFGNNFLPLRGGELLRTVMISSRSTLEMPYVLATAASERAADAIALVLIAGLALRLLPERPDWIEHAATSFAALAAAAALTIAFLPRFDRLLSAAVRRVGAAGTRLERALDQALRGLRAFHDTGRLSLFVALTVCIWSLDAITTTIAAGALGMAIPLRASFLLIAALGLSSALPSTPGYVGIYQFVAVSVLPPFGLSRTDAIAYILVAQVMSYIVNGLWGGIGLTRYRA
jgi:glycosyltransferase 2 family protein